VSVTQLAALTANGPTNQMVCAGSNVTFCTVASGTGPFSYLWFKDSVLIAGPNQSCLTITNANLGNAGLYCVVVQGLCASLTNCATLKINVCGQVAFCALTQGFYGNSNGKFNVTSSATLLPSLLTPNLVVGKLGVRSLTIAASSSSLLQQRLPANGTPATLPNSGDQNLATGTLPLASKGKFDNVFLGQTITLSLNVRLNASLLSFTLTPTFCTQGVLPGPDALFGTADDQLNTVANPPDIQSFTIPASVLSALTDAVLGINNSTVQGLLELANRALAGQATGVASVADINAAVDAINRGFDDCRVLVNCPSGLVADSSNDAFTSARSLSPSAAKGSGSKTREPDLPPTASNLRVRTSNINATKDPGEPILAGNLGGKSLWWLWQAPASGLVTIQTHGSSFDTLLGVFRGSSISNLTLMADNDDYNGLLAAQVSFMAQAGTNYEIAADGYDAASGTVVLTILVNGSHLGPLGLLPNDQIRLKIQGELGGTYTIEASSDLLNWTPITSMDNNNGTLQFTDPGRNGDRRYYRVKQEL
jgi:hypothetical protein